MYMSFAHAIGFVLLIISAILTFSAARNEKKDE